MYFIFDSFFQFLFLLIISGALFKFGRKKWSRIFFVAAFVWVFIISSTPLPYYLMKNLEKSSGSVADTDLLNQDPAEKVIVVLGGGITNDPSLSINNRLSMPSNGRFVEGVRLYKKMNNTKIVFSGHTDGKGASQAEEFANLSLIFGVQPADTLWIPNGANTKGEAYAFEKRFGKETTVILVTDANHMKRSRLWFEYYGIHVIPSPTNYLVKDDRSDEFVFPFIPSHENVMFTNKLIHEYLGLLWFYITT